MRTHKLATCDRILKREQVESRALSNGRAKDGDGWTCTCGRRFVHVCNEAEGCYWVPVAHRSTEG